MIADLAIVAFTGAFAWRGWRRGLVASLTGLAGFAAAAAAAVFGYPALSAVLRPAGFSRGAADLAAAVLIFAGVSIGVWFVGRTITRVLRLTKWGTVNAAGGGAFGVLWALGWVTAVLLAISVIPAPPAIADNVERSAFARAIVREAPGWATRIARTDIRSMLGFFQPRERLVAIRATDDFRRAPVAERQLFDLANEERRARGIRVFAWDERLAGVARAHAADMYLRGYFAHEDPDGRSPADRLRARDVPFLVTGENLALAPAVTIAHNRLMLSKRHRVHLLARSFARLGVGAVYGRQGLLVVEEFAG